MKIDGLEALKGAAKRLRDIPAASARAAFRSVNSVTAKLSTESRRDIGAEINLTQAYIKSLQTVVPATSARPVAYIKMRMRAIRMARFQAKQLTVRAANPKRAKGDRRRGIPAGKKQAGVAVKILRKGGRSSRKAGFLIPLRSGNTDGGNGMGVFVRTGPGKGQIKHKYGPSPDQLFTRWIKTTRPNIGRLLADAYRSQLRFELTGARK